MYMELFVFISIMVVAIALACILIYIRHCAKTQKKVDHLWIWLLGIAFAVVLILFWTEKSRLHASTFSSFCVQTPIPAKVDNAESFDLAVKKTCIAQTYLKGIPADLEASNPGDILLEQVNAQKSDFLALVPQNLDSNQIMSLFLAYDKLGNEAFKKQMAQHSLSDWEIENVGSIFFDMAESFPSSNREENLKYFWVLFHLYMGTITWDDVWDFPIKSYLNLDVDEIYINDYPTWDDKFIDTLSRGFLYSSHEAGIVF